MDPQYVIEAKRVSLWPPGGICQGLLYATVQKTVPFHGAGYRKKYIYCMIYILFNMGPYV